MRRWGPANVLLALTALALVTVVGCGGSGGSPTNPNPPPQSSITFAPAGAVGPNSVSLRRGTASTTTVLVLEVVASDVTDLYGVAFDLVFPNNILRFDGAAEGDFLGASGQFEASLQVTETPAGSLVVGLTRLGAVGGADGTGTLMTLEFRAIGNGGGSFVFDNEDAFDSNGDVQMGIAWSAGTVQVVL